MSRASFVTTVTNHLFFGQFEVYRAAAILFFALTEQPISLALMWSFSTLKLLCYWFASLKRLTNVVRMFELLQKDSPRQICYYQPGIGTYDAKVPLQEQTPSSASKLSMLVDAALAKCVTFLVQPPDLWDKQLIVVPTWHEAEYESTSLEDIGF